MPPATAVTTRSSRFESLDLWRGFACLLVVIHHSNFYVHSTPGMTKNGILYWVLSITHRFWIGVPLFFVISGYCITASATFHIQSGRSIHTFFLRRFRRIFPPYWTWLAISMSVVFLTETWLEQGFFQDRNIPVPNPAKLTGSQLFGNITLTEVWRSDFWGSKKLEFLGHSWSLGYEEFFYAVSGLLIITGRWHPYMMGLLTFLSLAMAIAEVQANSIFFNPYWIMFAAGVFLYFTVHSTSQYARPAFLLLIAGAMLYIGKEPRTLLVTAPNEIHQSIFFSLFFAGLLCLLHPIDLLISRARVLGGLRWIGTISYSVYLVHWPTVKIVSKLLSRSGFNSIASSLLVTIPCCVFTTLVIGYCFNRMVERHFQSTQSGG